MRYEIGLKHIYINLSSDSDPEDAEGLLIKEMLKCIKQEVEGEGEGESRGGFAPGPYKSFGYESYFQ